MRGVAALFVTQSSEATMVTRDEFFVIGKEIRTSNADEASGKGRIAGLWSAFVSEGMARAIPNRTARERLVAVYSEYANKADGQYSLLVGAEVKDLRDVPAGMVGKVVPPARYAKVTSERGAIPAIVIGVWQRIWQMPAEDLGGERAFGVDFEVYDANADPNDTQIEVYLSLR
jgi:predicted transcriptional regulator YdeE